MHVFFPLYPVYFLAITFRSFSFRHFGHWNISVTCLTVILKTHHSNVFSLYFQTFRPKWPIFFSNFKNALVYDWKMTENKNPACIHPLMPNTRLDRSQALFLKSSVLCLRIKLDLPDLVGHAKAIIPLSQSSSIFLEI